MNVEAFSPAGGRYRIFSVEQAQVGPAWQPYASLLFHGERQSLRVSAGQHEEYLISNAQFATLPVFSSRTSM